MSTLSQEIQILIDRVQKLPNGELRNYLKSDLARCKALARALEMDAPQSPPDYQKATTTNFTGISRPTGSQCICPPGARDRSCQALTHRS